MNTTMRWARGAVGALGLWMAALPLAAGRPKGEAKVLQAVLPGEACSLAFLAPQAGQAYQYRFLEAPDLQDRWFLLLKKGDRRVLLELRLAQGAAAEVLERRAWMLRNRQRRLLTEVDGYKACDTRFGVPVERLEKALDQAEAGTWSKARWPKAAKPAALRTEKHK